MRFTREPDMQTILEGKGKNHAPRVAHKDLKKDKGNISAEEKAPSHLVSSESILIVSGHWQL